MRSRSLYYPADWNRFLVITRKAGSFRRAARGVTLTLQSSEDAENDTVAGNTGTGSAGQNPGTDFRTHAPHGQVVEVAAHSGGRADDLGRLRHGPRVHGPLVLRAPVPLPHAVLLAV